MICVCVVAADVPHWSRKDTMNFNVIFKSSVRLWVFMRAERSCDPCICPRMTRCLFSIYIQTSQTFSISQQPLHQAHRMVQCHMMHRCSQWGPLHIWNYKHFYETFGADFNTMHEGIQLCITLAMFSLASLHTINVFTDCIVQCDLVSVNRHYV